MYKRQLDDHRVFGTSIVPAAVFVDLALAAAALDGPPGATPTLDDVVLHEAMVLDDAGESTMQTIVEPDGRFEIFGSRGPTEPWRLHVSGRMRAPAPSSAAAPDGSVDITKVLERCPDAISDAEHLAALRSRGLDFGPSLGGVIAIHRGDGEALGEITLPRSERTPPANGGIHPALLDAAIQVVAAVVTSGGGDDSSTYLPISIDQVTRRRPAGTRLWSHVRMRTPAAGAERSETMTADVTIIDDSGSVIALIDGLRLKRADTTALARLGGADPLDDWLYEVAWRERVVDEPVPAEMAFVGSPAAIGAVVNREVDRLRELHELDHYEAMLAELDAISTDLVVDAFARMGASFEPGRALSTESLRAETRHTSLVSHLLDELAADGIVRRSDEGWLVLRRPEIDLSAARWDSLLTRYPLGVGEITMTRRCGEQLAEALRGDVDPLQLLFPGGSLESAEQMYQVSPIARFYNSLAAEAVAAAVADLPDNRDVRVLEIGAGTGGTTSFVLPRLPAGRTRYTYTDVSPHFLGRARQKFAAFDGVDYRPLDIEGDLGAQGLLGEQFDIVVAANVLHATADLRHTFDNVAAMLAPGGVLVLVEMVLPQRFISITFGLTEGWWRFHDGVRRSSPLLRDEEWCEFLIARSFAEPVILPAPTTGGGRAGRVQAVVLVKATTDTAAQGSPTSLGTWRIVAPPTHPVARRLAEALTARGALVEIASSVPPSRTDGSVLFAVGDEPLREALAVTQALIATGNPTRLCFVTRGAQSAGDTAPDPQLATIWGFAKSIALEHPQLHPRCIDLDPAGGLREAELLASALLANDGEDQIAIRSGSLHVARLVRSRPSTPTTPVELAVTTRGTLDNLVLRPLARRDPAPGEVEIRVHATGLNFKDVLNALDLYPGDPGPLGGECAGTVVSVGAGVEHLSAGDAVVGIAPGAFRSHVTCSASLVVAMPCTMSFAEAAGLPIANVTAAFALGHVGCLASGERVLIHAAAGGVGLAAVHLAHRLGAEVYATAGSDDKRQLLRDLGVAHVYDSRSLAFADQILMDTDGQGVDVVLNSLAGEFVAQSMRLVRPGGRFLEIGKRDHAGDPGPLPAGVADHVIDWGEVAVADPDLIRSILVDVVDAAATGTLSRLPMRTFPIERAEAAFRFMAQARHVGKVVVTQPAAAADQAPRPVRADGTYLVTGGLSGLGLLTAQHLVGSGARHVALVGRRPPDAHAADAVATMEAAGAQVTVLQADVSDPDALRHVLATITGSMLPLIGIIHAAGALDDGEVSHLTWPRFETVLAAKVTATRQLDALTAAMPLDHFVLYGSMASMVGSPGQSNHAAANAFLDAWATRRASSGRAGLSIDWGAWSEIGAAAERGIDKVVVERGIGAIDPSDGLSILDRLLSGTSPHVGVSPVQWSVLLQRYGAGGPPPYFAEVAVATERHATADRPAAATVDLMSRLTDLAPERRAAMLLDFVRDQAAYVLALGVGQVDVRVPLNDLGLDSLMAVELRNLLGAALGESRPIPATLVFDYPTIEAIAGYLLAEVLADVGTGGTAQVSPPTSSRGPSPADGMLVASMLDDLENLTDAEIDAQLARRSAT